MLQIQSRHRILWWSLLPLFCIICGFYSVNSGADTMWDLKNYHLYNPYEAWHNRYTVDVAPAQFATYLNPIMDYPFYFAIRLFNGYPRSIAFMMGLPQGFNLWAVTLIGWDCLGSLAIPPVMRASLTVLALIIGATGAGTVPLIGSTTGDVPAAVPIMLGLLVFLRGMDRALTSRASAARYLFAAGAIAGLGIGAKLTMGLYGIGLAAALIVLPYGLFLRGMRNFLFGAGLGVLITGGYHLIRMAVLFGNPVLPIMNTLFQSPYWENAPFRDTRFLPRSLFEAVFYPYEWALGARFGLVSELTFRDIRVAFVFTLALIAAATWIIRLISERRIAPIPRNIRALLVFAIVSYTFWLLTFSIYRYLIPMELLSGVLIVLGLAALSQRIALPALAIASAIACVITTVPLEWGHTPFRDHYIEVSAPPIPPQALVVIVGADPVSYLLPFLDPSVVWISALNNFLSPDQHNLLMQHERDLVANHSGPLMVLDAGASEASVTATLSAFGLAADTGACGTISSNLGGETYKLCEAHRAPS